MKLTAQAVNELAKQCANVGDDGDAVKVEGIVSNYLLSKSRLEEHKEEIGELLKQLPEVFTVGGGGSFLSAAFDRNDQHWGEHPDMERLFVLAIGAGKASYLLPREIWPALPGGMPYLVIKD